jgi:hypothetical protein
MPLVAANLQSDLESLMTDHGATAADCAALWASAFGSYASDVVPESTGVSAAQAALETALAAAFASSSALAAMDTAFTAAATTIAAGMAPAFAGVPPPAPIGWAALLAEPYPETAADAAAKVANAIHAWMITGQATLVAPPNTVVPWS